MECIFQFHISSRKIFGPTLETSNPAVHATMILISCFDLKVNTLKFMLFIFIIICFSFRINLLFSLKIFALTRELLRTTHIRLHHRNKILIIIHQFDAPKTSSIVCSAAVTSQTWDMPSTQPLQKAIIF